MNNIFGTSMRYVETLPWYGNDYYDILKAHTNFGEHEHA